MANDKYCCDLAEDEYNLIKILDEEDEYSTNNYFRLKTAPEYKR